MSELKEKKSYKDTLNLPKTDFSIRSNAKTKEPELLESWKKENLDEKTYKNLEKKKKKFILHDGPPYANGSIHMGHAYNKVFKDIVCKYRRMSGDYVPLKPGWDCHGLPIEFKVLSELREQKKENVSRDEFKKLCRAYANKWIDIQREEFKSLGIFADWEDPYITMAPSYEASTLRAFAKFVEGGYIKRKEKTVPWCHSCKTVLAAAEIEYKDRKDPSTYIFFPLKNSKKTFEKIDKEIGFLVWTTTPWTIPLNRAVVLNPSAKYVLLEGKDNKAFVVAERLVDAVCSKLEIEKKILAEFDSKNFVGQEALHPFVENLSVPILLDNVVTLDEGTACMHMAPGCGPEDYLLAVANDLEIFSPLSEDGKYTEAIEPKELVGMPIVDGQIWVIRKLAELGRLIHKSSIRHSYPHCWRCKQGLMFRATEQWFCNLAKNNLIEKTLKEVDKINLGSERSKVRFKSTIGSRVEWCISRQKIWGVPVPAILCSKCGEAYLDSKFIEKIADGVEKEGIEFWDVLTPKLLVEKNILPADFKCKCTNSNLEEFKLERDILDVWFDSGVSSFAVLQYYKELGFPADLYFEGSDQHRGWFQSSLLSSMIINGTTPTKAIITHGFVEDIKGHKMSKLLGNVTTPAELIEKYSRDILRLWVSSCDHESDMVVSEVVMRNVAEVYRKIRNTSRFLLSNLYDFDMQKHAVAVSNMLKLDQFALAKLHEVDAQICNCYEKYDLVELFKILSNYCANDLSSFYLDITKDRLYTDKVDGVERRSAQTVCYHILDTLTRLMAPILSFLSEETSGSYQKNKKKSIHLQEFAKTINVWELLVEEQTKKGVFGAAPGYMGLDVKNMQTFKMNIMGGWSALSELRDVVLKALEEEREKGVIKHSLEAKVKIYLDASDEQAKQILDFIKNLKAPDNKDRFLKDFFIVSQCEIFEKPEGLEKSNQLSWIYIKIEHADGVKCPRCWQWSDAQISDELCLRCKKIVG